MKRKYLVFTALLLALTMALVGCGGGAGTGSGAGSGSGSGGGSQTGDSGSGGSSVDVIKVGLISPFTGSAAYTGNQIKMGVDAAVKKINEAGGIKSLGGAKIEVVYGDSQGKPEVGAAEAERLITRENVVALIGAYTSAVTITTTQVAEKHGVVHMIDEGISNDVLARGFRYSFRVIADAQIAATNTVKHTIELSKVTGVDLKTAVVLHENTAFGTSMMNVIVEQAPNYGLEILDTIGYPPTATDLTTEVAKALQAKPDVILWSGYLADGVLGARAFHQLKGQETVKAIIGNTNGAFSAPQFIVDAGEEVAQGYFDNNHRWNVNSPDYEFIMGELERQNAQITHDVIDAYASALVLFDAIERAGTTDREAIRDAVAATSLKLDILPQPEPVEFDEKGQNMNARTVLTQVQGDKIVVVYPEEWAESEPIMNWAR